MKRLFTIVLSCLLMASFVKAQTSAPTSFVTEGADGQIKLTWNKVDGATGYEISRDGQVLQTITNANDTVYNDRGPVAGSVHFYCVRAMQGGNPSPYVNCTYDSSATNAFIASDSTSDGFIQLSWSLPSNCLEAAGDEDIYMEVWDSTAEEEFHSSIFDTSALPNGQDTSKFVRMQPGAWFSQLFGSSATAPNLVNRFGYSVAVDGDQAIVGSTTQDNGIGAAYIFEYDGSNWVEQQKLTPSDGQVGDQFGHAVAIDGDHAAVVSNTDTGKAYAFHFDGSNWNEQDILMPNFPDTVDMFGQSVAVKGDQIYVGAPAKYMDLGVVYAFRKNGTNWPQYNMIAASSLQFGQNFGYDISFNDDYAFIGAPNESGSGRVYVLEGQGAGWSHHDNFAPSSLNAGARFGESVTVENGEAAVSAPHRNSNTGEVFFYELNGTNWQANGSAVPGSANPGDEFGKIMDITNGRLAVGIPTDNSSTGKVYVYEELGGSWNLDQQITNGSVGTGGEFGHAVAINTTGKLLVGSPGDDNDRGSLFAYEKNGTWTQTQHIQSGNVSSMTFELWAYVKDRSSTNPVSADDDVALRLNTTSDNRVNVKYPGVPPKYFNYVVPLKTWTHLSYVVNADSNFTKLYANGRLVAKLPEALPVGRERIGEFNGETFSGRVDNVRQWDDVRTAVEIENNFDNKIPSGASGLLECWRVEGSPPGLITVIGSGIAGSLPGSSGATDKYYPKLFKGEVKHWLGPNKTRAYSLSFHTYGLGVQLCNRLNDHGSTAPFQDPIVSSNSNLPDTTVVSWVNNSDAVSYFRVFRDSVFLGVVDSTGTQFKDGFAYGNESSLQNGVTYNYCVEPFSTMFDRTYDQTCTNGSTYDIDLQASDNAYPGKIKLTWAPLDSFSNSLVIERDGVMLATLDSNKTKFTDNDPIPGQDHVYELQMKKEGNIAAAQVDTGSVESIGVLAGNVLTNTGHIHNEQIIVEATGVVQGDTFTYYDTTGIAGDFQIDKVYFGESASYTLTALGKGLAFSNAPINRTLSLETPQATDIYFFSDKDVNIQDVPDLISSFSATPQMSKDQIQLNWDYERNDTTWFVLYKDDNIVKVLTDSNETKYNNYIDDEITPGDTHSYEIMGYWRSNDTIYRQALTEDASIGALAAVDSLIAQANATVGNVSLNWNHTSTNIDGFFLYRDSDQIATVHVDSNYLFKDWNGVPGVNYTYGIKAFSTIEDSTYTSPLTTADTLTYPGLTPPHSFTAQQDTDRVILSWKYDQSANSNFDGFLLLRDGPSETDTLDLIYYKSTVSTTATIRNYQYTDYTGVPNENYTYRVISYKANPEYQSGATAVTQMFPSVHPPINFQVIADTLPGYIKMGWEHHSENYDGFIIASGSDTIARLPMSARSYADALLTNSSASSKSYSLSAYRVVDGKNYYSNSPQITSNPGSISDDGLQEPKNFVASDIYPNQVQLKWDYPPYIFAKFRIYKNGELIDSLGQDGRFYYDTEVNPGDEPLYQVEAVLNGNTSPLASDVGKLKSLVTVKGEAITSSNIGIPDVRVEVRDGDKVIGKATTDETGFFRITELPADTNTYFVTASRVNTKFNQPVRILEIVPDSNSYSLTFTDKDKWVPYLHETDSIADPVAFTGYVDSLNRSIMLRWNASSPNYDNFDLLKGVSPVASIDKGEPLSYTDANVAPGNQYIYEVSAEWGEQEGMGAAVEVAIPKLSPVVALQAVRDVFRDEVTLYWSHPNNNVTHYEVKRNGSVVQLVEPGEPLTYVDSTGLPFHNYNYEVTVALNTPEGLITSDPRIVEAQFPEVAPVTDLNLNANPSHNRVEVTWQHTSDHYDYAVVYRNHTPFDTISRTETSKLSYDYWGTPEDTMAYAVSAVVEKNGTLYESDTSWKEIVFPPVYEPEIQNVTSGVNKLKISGNYNPPDGFTGYELWRKPSYQEDSIFVASTDQASSDFEFIDDGALPDSSYEYMVRAYKDMESTHYSGYDKITTTFPKLAKPLNLTATDGEYFNHVRLEWEYESTSNTGFIIYRDGQVLDTIGSTKLNNPGSSGIGVRKYIDMIEDSDTLPETYEYEIKAYKIQESNFYFSNLEGPEEGFAEIQRFSEVTSEVGDNSGDNFGQSVSLSQDLALAGGGHSANYAKTFVIGGDNNFGLDDMLEPIQESGPSPAFGYDVRIDDDRIGVSAPWAWSDDANSVTYRSGEIYIYDKNNNQLQRDTILRNFNFEPLTIWDSNSVNETYVNSIIEPVDTILNYINTDTIGEIESMVSTPTSSDYSKGLEFTVHESTRINEITVFASMLTIGAQEDIVVNIRDTATSNIVASHTITFPTLAGFLPFNVPLNTNLPPGDYAIDAMGTTVHSLGYSTNSAGMPYPYFNNDSTIEITGATDDTTNYNYFYNWEVEVIDTTFDQVHQSINEYERDTQTSTFNVQLDGSPYDLNEEIRLDAVHVQLSKTGEQPVAINDMTLVKDGSDHEINLFNTRDYTDPTCSQDTVDALVASNHGGLLLADTCATTVTGTFAPNGNFDNDFNAEEGEASGDYRLEYTVVYVDTGTQDRDTLHAEVSVNAVNLRFVTLPGGKYAEFLTKNAQMGTSFDLSGNMVAGGAPHYKDGDDRGLVTTFHIDTTGGWSYQDTLEPGFTEDRLMGRDVALTGNKMLVGFPGYAPNEDQWSLGYVDYYQLGSNGQWNHQQQLDPSQPGGGDDQFGFSVATDQNLLAIGAPGDDWDANPSMWDAGAVELFKYNSGDNNFEHQRKIVIPDDPQNRYIEFGHSVAMKGNFMAVGAPGYHKDGKEVGAMFLYEKNESDEWVFKREFVNPDEQDNSRFGHAVDLAGNTVMVGAKSHDEGTATDAGKVYFFYVREQVDSVFASDGTEGNKTRVSWAYDGIRSNLSKFHVYRDSTLIEAVDPNKNFVFDYDGVPGKKYVYSVRAVTLDEVEGAPGSDIGWRENNGILDGRVVTESGAVAIPNVNIKAWAHVEGEYYEYKTTTDLSGEFKIKGMYYSDSARYFVTATYQDHDIIPDTQSIEFNIQQNERMLDPFKDRTAYVVEGRIKREQQNCGLDSVQVTMLKYFDDGDQQSDGVFTNEQGAFSFVVTPFDESIDRYVFTYDTSRTIRFDGAVFTEYLELNRLSDTIKNSNITSMATGLADIEDTTAYPVEITVKSPCGNITRNWIVQITTADGCYQSMDTTNSQGVLSLDLPPNDYTFRVIDIVEDQRTSETIPVVDYLKVRPRSLNILDYHYPLEQQTGDFSEEIEFVYHKAPVISLTTDMPNLCGNPDSTYIAEQGDSVTIDISIEEMHDGQLCSVNEGFIVVRNNAAKETEKIIEYDEENLEFPDYGFRVGDPNLVPPHTRSLVVEYHTESDGFLGRIIRTIIVDGTGTIPGNDVFVHLNKADGLVQMPLMVLRDPPGDNSYSYIDSGATFEKSVFHEKSEMVYTDFFTEFELSVVGILGGFNIENSSGEGYERSNAANYEIEVTESIQTPASSDLHNASQSGFMTGNSGDVIVGGGLALQYGIVRNINVEDQCEVTDKPEIALGAEINTTWIYTVDQINHLIDQFKRDSTKAAEGNLSISSGSSDLSPDSTVSFYSNMIRNWESILDYHKRETLPHYHLCDPDNLPDVSGSIQADLDDWRRNSFCNEIGNYATDNSGEETFVLKPEDEWGWSAELVSRYNKVKEVYRRITQGEIDDSQGFPFTAHSLDTLSVDNSYMDMYGPNAENITFSGGTGYTKEQTTIESRSAEVRQVVDKEFIWNAYGGFSNSASTDIGVSGFGAEVTFSATVLALDFRIGGGQTKQNTTSQGVGVDVGTSQSIGYHLSDDDPGDQYSVTIIKGIQSGHTPYFSLFGGRTSCPVEPGAIPRDMPQLELRYPNDQPVSNTVHNADPGEQVVFPLKISSLNQFGESRWYEIYQVENTNPYNASMRINGNLLNIENGVDFFVPADSSLYAYLYITPGPEMGDGEGNTVSYDYEGLQVGLRSVCDPYVNDIVTLNVHYRHPCSEVSIIEPGDNWVVNGNTSVLNVYLSDYDPYNDKLKRVQLVQRRMGTMEWDTIQSFSAEELATYFENTVTYSVPTRPVPWDVSDEEELPDGKYELMAIANCGKDGIVQSNRVTGTIDRSGFKLFGQPEPADGILSMGDEISVTYNKEIDCPYAMSDGVWTFRRDSATGEEVGVTASCNGNKLIFELDSMDQLEGRTIYAMVDSIQDKNYNLQEDTITWSFQISNNPIYWSPQKLALTVERGKSKNAQVRLESQSSVNRSYTLMNDELWLTYSEAAGTIQPNGKTLNLELDAGNKDLGTYRDTIAAQINNFTTIELPVEMNVIAPAPDWTVDGSQYDHSINVIANASIDSMAMDSTDTTTVISAWIDGEMRGVGRVKEVGAGYKAAYLTVYGDDEDTTKSIDFRVWLADSGKIYKGHPGQQVTYTATSSIYGTTPSPVQIFVNTASDEMDFIPLNKGWTWFSINKDMESMAINDVLSSLTPHTGDVIMTLDTNLTAEYLEGSGWVDMGLSKISTDQGYMIHLDEADTLWIYGEPTDRSTLALSSGWNFIGYQPQDTSLVDIAFQDSTIFQNGDIIRNQETFAEYEDGAWKGNLEIMRPYEAYKVKLGKAGFTFYRGSGEWDVNPHEYQHGMRMMAVIEVNGHEFREKQSQALAFVDGECRGKAQLQYVEEVDRYIAPMMIYGNESGEEVTFKVKDALVDTVYDCAQQVTFTPSKLIGRLRDVFVLSPEATTGIDQLSADGTQPTFELSPNPFTTELRVTFDEEQASSYVVEVYNGVGETFFQRSLASVKGANKWVIKPGERLASGMYYVTIKQDDDIIRTFKVVKE